MIQVLFTHQYINSIKLQLFKEIFRIPIFSHWHAGTFSWQIFLFQIHISHRWHCRDLFYPNFTSTVWDISITLLLVIWSTKVENISFCKIWDSKSRILECLMASGKDLERYSFIRKIKILWLVDMIKCTKKE